MNNGDIDYTVRATWQLRYLNNNGYENAGTANGTGSTPLMPTDARERDHNAQNQTFGWAVSYTHLPLPTTPYV